MKGEHLHASRRFALDLPDAERFRIIRNDVRIITEHMDNVRTITRNMLDIDRGSMEAPCLIVTAESNHGKTTICNAIRGLSEDWSHKVRYVSFVKTTENIKPLEKLLRAIGLDVRTNAGGRAGLDISIVAEYCLANDIRAIFMDEFHDSLKGLSRPDQDRFLSVLRGMCSAPVYMSFFAFGTSLALSALGHDPQYVRRFEKYDLTPWAVNDAEYLNFLDTWEELAPLATPSNLSSAELSTYIHTKTNGVVGNIVSMLKGAACYGIQRGYEQITMETLIAASGSKWLSQPRA